MLGIRCLNRILGARTMSVDPQMILNKKVLAEISGGCIEVILEPLLSLSERANFPINADIYKL